MRGARSRRFPANLLSRIIPADAGSTSASFKPPPYNRDHPRGCGEHTTCTLIGFFQVGSSPRMRGALREIGLKGVCLRIIPADAGSTDYVGFKPYTPKDHPRGCGEHHNWHTRTADEEGSSPRMRGAPFPFFSLRLKPWIIPADAGSTSALPYPDMEVEDHPRGCGEHDDRFVRIMEQVGSSPRMRGAPFGLDQLSEQERDHPRGCGEHDVGAYPLVTGMGSSPRMRGALDVLVDEVALEGIIPADAGSTFICQPCHVFTPDHPRGCGEHGSDGAANAGKGGSSPRMRGARMGCFVPY